MISRPVFITRGTPGKILPEGRGVNGVGRYRGFELKELPDIGYRDKHSPLRKINHRILPLKEIR
jgi:hypothetical protein